MAFIYNGVDIKAVVYNGVSLTQLVFNGVAVWNSGPTVGVYYGGFPGNSNTVTRINASGALVGSETNVGTGRPQLAGAPVGNNGVYYAGGFRDAYSNQSQNGVTRINASGALVGSETNIGTARFGLAGAPVGNNGIYYGGSDGTAAGSDSRHVNTVTRINSTGALVGSETNVGTARRESGGASVGDNGVYYAGGRGSSAGDPIYNLVTRINASGALVGSETNIGTAKMSLAGTHIGGNGVFYGGNTRTIFNMSQIVTRINASGALVGSETNVGTGMLRQAAASVGDIGVYYGGGSAQNPVNKVTRINASGALVGSETNVGTARSNFAGAGL